MLLVLLIPLGSGLLSWFGPAHASYMESYLVRAGDTSAASGGVSDTQMFTLLAD